MNRKTRKPTPVHETTSLYRFCLSHGLSLSPQERSAEGIALSKVARERELPLVRVRERIEDRWIRSRLYPVSFLREWLVRYTEAKAAASATDPLPEAQSAAMGWLSRPTNREPLRPQSAGGRAPQQIPASMNRRVFTLRSRPASTLRRREKLRPGVRLGPGPSAPGSTPDAPGSQDATRSTPRCRADEARA